MKKVEGASEGRDARSGSEGRFRILATFLHHRTSLRRFLSRYLLSTQDVEDIAQEAFLRAFEAEKKRVIDEPRAFLFRIAQNLVMSEFNRKSRKITDYIEDYEGSDVLLDVSTLEDNVMAQQKLGIYCEAVASLPLQCRRVFLLKKVYGMSHNEIAAHLGIAVSTIEKHLAKGIRQCSRVVAERYGEGAGAESRARVAARQGQRTK